MLRPLYGGAIACFVPDRFDDVSAVREVPDHQEVFADVKADESLIVEILNLAPGNSLEEAAAVHWKGLLNLNRAQASQVGEVAVVDFADTLPSFTCPPSVTVQPGVLLMMGHMKAPKFNETAVNSIDVFMALIRLEQQSSDILVVLNSATEINPNSSSAQSFLSPNPSGSLALFKQIVQSFRIVDWGLFP